MVPVPQRASPAQPPQPSVVIQVAPDRLPHATLWGPRVTTPGIVLTPFRSPRRFVNSRPIVFASGSPATVCDIFVFSYVASADFFFRRSRLFFARPRGRPSLRSRARAHRWLVCAPRAGTIPTRFLFARLLADTITLQHFRPKKRAKVQRPAGGVQT